MFRKGKARTEIIRKQNSIKGSRKRKVVCLGTIDEGRTRVAVLVNGKDTKVGRIIKLSVEDKNLIDNAIISGNDHPERLLLTKRRKQNGI